MSDIELYMKELSTTRYLDIMGDGDEDNTEARLPYDFLSEEGGAKKFKESTKKVSIRNCIEYKCWVKWFHKRYGPPICCLSAHTVTIQVHHHPLTLEDYYDMAIAFIHNNNLKYTSGLISDLVMRWHYKQIVPGCFLSKTEHDNWHDNHNKFIPEECVYGNLEGLLTDPITSKLITEYHYSKIITYMPEFYQKHKELFENYDPSGIDKLMEEDIEEYE